VVYEKLPLPSLVKVPEEFARDEIASSLALCACVFVPITKPSVVGVMALAAPAAS